MAWLIAWQVIPRILAFLMSVVCRVQSLFNSLGDEVKGKTIGLGGDGRYFNKDASQTILKLAAGAGLKKASHMSSIPQFQDAVCIGMVNTLASIPLIMLTRSCAGLAYT